MGLETIEKYRTSRFLMEHSNINGGFLGKSNINWEEAYKWSFVGKYSIHRDTDSCLASGHLCWKPWPSDFDDLPINNGDLVGGWATPLKNMKVNWDD